MKKLNILYTLLLSVVLFACSNTDDMFSNNSGYLTVNVSAVNSTYNKGTRAIPAEYNAKQMAVEIVNSAGKIVAQTDDASMWAQSAITLMAGEYTINVHSNNWDGNDSGRDVPFYAGSATATVTANAKTEANVVCTLANVKVSVNFDASVADKFASAYVEVASMVAGILPQTFTMGNEATLASAYFPVGNMTATLHVTNHNGTEYTMATALNDVQARDHYILNYSVQASGEGEFTVTADDSETTYSYNLYVPGDPNVAFNAIVSADAWATFAYLEGKITKTDITEVADDKVVFQVKAAGEEDWTNVAATKDGDHYKATARNLSGANTYSCRLAYVDGANVYNGSTTTFTTDVAAQLPNSGFEDWCVVSKLNYACTSAEQSNNLFWGSSNVNAIITQINGASGTTDAHSGEKAALLESKYVSVISIKKFAAASLFSGAMPVVKGTNGAAIDFGRPFASRPSALTGFFKYSTDKVNRAAALKMPDGSNVPLTSEDNDLWSCYVALTTAPYTFDNSSQALLNATIKDFKSGADPTVIAYGEVPDANCVQASDWTPFSVNLHYFDTTTKPTHIIVVISSSKYGDYFAGCDKSKLYIDDLELVYDEPSF